MLFEGPATGLRIVSASVQYLSKRSVDGMAKCDGNELGCDGIRTPFDEFYS